MKKLILISLSVFAILILSACNRKVDDNTLTFWAYEPQSLADKRAYETLIEKFENLHEVDVRISWVPKDSYNQRLNTAIINRRNPDVAYLDQPLIASYQENDLLLDLTDKLENSEALSVEDFFAAALATTEIDGRYYGLPLTITTTILLYNKAYVTNPELIVDWASLLQVAQEKSSSSIAAFEGIGAGGYAGWYFGGLVYSGGGSMVNEDETTLTFAEEPGVQTVQFLRDLYNLSPASIRNSQSAFGNGMVIFRLGGGSDVDSLRTNFPSLDFGSMLIPPRVEGATPYSNIGGDNLVIFNSTNKADLSFKLIEFLNSAENALQIAEFTGNFPANQSAIGETYNNDPHRLVLLEQLQYAAYRPRLTNWLQANDVAIGPALEAILTSDVDLVARLNQAKSEAEAILWD